MQDVTPCPNCQGRTLFAGPETSSWAGQHGPDYLNGLGGIFKAARLTVVVCRDCGLMRFFAGPKATAKLKESTKWHAVTPVDRGGF